MHAETDLTSVILMAGVVLVYMKEHALSLLLLAARLPAAALRNSDTIFPHMYNTMLESFHSPPSPMGRVSLYESKAIPLKLS